MSFTGKRGLHVDANVGVPVSFAGKRGLHVAANVGVSRQFSGKRGLHMVANVTDPGPGTPVWHTEFTFKFTSPGGLEGGADGIAFLIKGRNTTWLGGDGGGMGYEGIPDALAIEFDTYGNSFDPDGNHIAIHTQGTSDILSSDSALIYQSVSSPDFHDGNPHDVMITYDGDRLDVYFESMTTPVLTYYIDLEGLLILSGGPSFGLTAATGNGYENHDILNWTLTTGDLHDFSYSDFSGGAGYLTLYGNAAIVGSVLRLTPSSGSQKGSAWRPHTDTQKFQAILASGSGRPSAPPTPPANDNWANAQSITGVSGTVSGDNTLATAETPDPLVDSPHNMGPQTMWYKWVAPHSGDVTFATSGSGAGQIYDTFIGVYQGSSLAALTELGTDDDSGPGHYSQLTLSVISGHTYYVEVTGYGSSGYNVGTFDLTWSLT